MKGFKLARRRQASWPNVLRDSSGLYTLHSNEGCTSSVKFSNKITDKIDKK